MRLGPLPYRPVHLVTEHSQGCTTRLGMPAEWIVSPPVRMGRDLAGRAAPRCNHPWHRLLCASPGCPAILAVYAPTMQRMLNRRLAAAEESNR